MKVRAWLGFAVLCGASCNAPPPPVVDGGAVFDAGAGVFAGAPVDAGPSVDAGTLAVLDAGVADAGHVDVADAGLAHATASPPAVPLKPSPVSPPLPAAHGGVFDRVLIKPKSAASPDDVAALAARHSAAKVEAARRTAGSYVVVRFVPTTPPRGNAEHKALIQKLQKSGAFAVVEGDRIMTLK